VVRPWQGRALIFTRSRDAGKVSMTQSAHESAQCCSPRLPASAPTDRPRQPDGAPIQGGATHRGAPGGFPREPRSAFSDHFLTNGARETDTDRYNPSNIPRGPAPMACTSFLEEPCLSLASAP